MVLWYGGVEVVVWWYGGVEVVVWWYGVVCGKVFSYIVVRWLIDRSSLRRRLGVLCGVILHVALTSLFAVAAFHNYPGHTHSLSRMYPSFACTLPSYVPFLCIVLPLYLPILRTMKYGPTCQS